jgi:hypothetical protein
MCDRPRRDLAIGSEAAKNLRDRFQFDTADVKLPSA